MVVRRKGRRGERVRPALVTTLVAGSALILILGFGGVASAFGGPARAAVPYGVAAPSPGRALDPGGVTFEVLPVPPTATPTAAPTPSPSGSHGGQLPVTGTDLAPPAWLFAAGVLLLLVGVSVVVASRRVRRHRA